MTELEERLRNSLREAAGTVPRSPHARADFERRLAERRTTRFRTSLLATAAAAVVMVGVAIPVVMNQDDDPPHERQAIRTPPSATSESSRGPGGGPPVPTKDGYLFAGPVELDTFVEDGTERAAVLTVEQDGDGERMCLLVRPSTGSQAPGTGCVPVPTWPTRPEGTGYVASHAVLGGETLHSGPLPNLLLFMTAPEVASLEVSHGNGAPVATELVAVSPRARFYLSDFGDTSDGFGYTAKDGAGKVLETAIT